MVSDFTHLLAYFYPRSPHGERLPEQQLVAADDVISIHALRMESDAEQLYEGQGRGEISIHALRMESDMMMLLGCGVLTEFLSTLSAWRATFMPGWPCESTARFLSTLSAWRATVHAGEDQAGAVLISIHALRMESDVGEVLYCYGNCGISIHALRMESDSTAASPTTSKCYFYPRSPHGERP